MRKQVLSVSKDWLAILMRLFRLEILDIELSKHSASKDVQTVLMSRHRLEASFQTHLARCFHMSCVVRKPSFCICENKDADQLRGNRSADQHLCFRFTDSTIPLLPTNEISSL